ncbi:hypothetical protein [Kitasatospora sp. NPDC002040]|uniref:hypothetical protein n=1 Tax=Kitasatospora sp. NPDC002040 TaxID=3154661 RepID=UPI003324B9B1
MNNLTDPTLRFRRYCTLQELRPDCEPVTLVEHGTAAPYRTGPASMPDHGKLRDQATVQLPGGGRTVAPRRPTRSSSTCGSSTCSTAAT